MVGSAVIRMPRTEQLIPAVYAHAVYENYKFQKTEFI